MKNLDLNKVIEDIKNEYEQYHYTNFMSNLFLDEKTYLKKLINGDIKEYQKIIYENKLVNNKNFIKEMVKLDIKALNYVNKELKEDKEIIFVAVAYNPSEFKQYTNATMQKDKNLRIAADKMHSFYAMDFKYRNNFDLAYIAVSFNPMNLADVSKNLQDNEEIVKMAVQKNALAFKYASKRLKGDIKFVKEIINYKSLSILAYISNDLKSNKEIFDIALSLDLMSLKYASKKIKSDGDFILKYFINKKYWTGIDYTKHIDKSLRNNKEFILKLINTEVFSLEYVSDKLKNDYDVVKEAVKKRGYQLMYASTNLQDNEEIALIAVNNCKSAIEFVSDRLINSNKYLKKIKYEE